VPIGDFTSHTPQFYVATNNGQREWARRDETYKDPDCPEGLELLRL